jgi:hypothetical protein
MERRITSARPGAGDLTGAWQRNAQKPGRNNQKPDRKRIWFDKKRTRGAFIGCDNTRKAALSSLFIEISRTRTEGDVHVDP